MMSGSRFKLNLKVFSLVLNIAMVFNWNHICICQIKMLKKWLWKVAMGTTAGRGSQTALGSRGQCRDRGQQSRAHPKDPNKTQEHLKASHTKIRQVNLHTLKHR